MRLAKTGDVLYCPDCGVEVTVTKSCECSDCNLVCCGKPMRPKTEDKSKGCCCCG